LASGSSIVVEHPFLHFKVKDLSSATAYKSPIHHEEKTFSVEKDDSQR
jgi:hypothetical protein